MGRGRLGRMRHPWIVNTVVGGLATAAVAAYRIEGRVTTGDVAWALAAGIGAVATTAIVRFILANPPGSEARRKQYNRVRPHSSLGYVPPAPEATLLQPAALRSAGSNNPLSAPI